MYCQIENCNGQGDPYCYKHYKYYIKEQLEEEGKTICSKFFHNSCVNVVEDNKKTCNICREQYRDYENKKKELINNTTGNPCKKCGKQFEMFLTRLNKFSTKCNHCLEVLREVERKRGPRERRPRTV